MIRPATFEDISAISRLYREQFKEMAKLQPDFIQDGDQSTAFIENTITDDDSDILLYEDNESIVGFILIQAKSRPSFPFIIPNRYCYIMDIIVTENSRGNGFGTALMNSAKNWALDHDCAFINLDVFSSNTVAISLYNKLGFVAKAQEMCCWLK